MTPHINLPYELFKVEEGLVSRIAQVTSWFRQVCYETPKFRVKLTDEQWADLLSSPEMSTLYSFYAQAAVDEREPSDGNTYDRWLEIANVLFCVEHGS